MKKALFISLSVLLISCLLFPAFAQAPEQNQLQAVWSDLVEQNTAEQLSAANNTKAANGSIQRVWQDFSDNTNSRTYQIPKTGDETHPLLLVLCGGACCVILFGLPHRKKHSA